MGIGIIENEFVFIIEILILINNFVSSYNEYQTKPKRETYKE
jgi:hypothetical protein